MDLVSNIHWGLPLPELQGDVRRTATIRGKYWYYHYGCDGVDDRGWGCGYRTLQTMCSWLSSQTLSGSGGGGGDRCPEVPTLKQIQEALVKTEDKPPGFLNSKAWIGSFEIALCVDQFFNVPCKILHVRRGRELEETIEGLYGHFDMFGSPVMMGGDVDNSSKGVLGLCSGLKGNYLLVLDPHYYGASVGKDAAQREGWVQWRKLDSFESRSFYNFCLPQYKAG
uniref:UFM1 specific peptidase 1 n=2 Tax=Latimeria chalumnae TaxID=7897 RepID=H3AKJ3_LATCH